MVGLIIFDSSEVSVSVVFFFCALISTHKLRRVTGESKESCVSLFPLLRVLRCNQLASEHKKGTRDPANCSVYARGNLGGLRHRGLEANGRWRLLRASKKKRRLEP